MIGIHQDRDDSYHISIFWPGDTIHIPFTLGERRAVIIHGVTLEVRDFWTFQFEKNSSGLCIFSTIIRSWPIRRSLKIPWFFVVTSWKWNEINHTKRKYVFLKLDLVL